jgi:hypothetical protein
VLRGAGELQAVIRSTGTKRMTILPLQFRSGHIFVELGGGLWLLDTGAPTSFGASSSVSFAGEEFDLGRTYLGLTVATLSQFVGVSCAGLLGADVLGRFDHIFDTAGGRLIVATGELEHSGTVVELDQLLGIPIVTARVASRDYRMFFDTGAQVSYFQDDSLMGFPSAGSVTDFYPGLGQFETDTHWVPVSLGGTMFTLRCGTLPGLLGMTLMMAGTKGIIGNELLIHRTVGYFPRRRVLVL